jgi:protein-tyrosine phosphatase
MIKTRLLFVCTGNICRSPSAEGVMRKLIVGTPLEGRVDIDSAGTNGYHIGASPDARSVEHAARRGIDLTPLRARQIVSADFSRFDYVLAMDEINIKHLRSMCPTRYLQRVKLLLQFTDGFAGWEVPDPYYGEAADFERVLDLVERGCRGLQSELLNPREYNDFDARR